MEVRVDGIRICVGSKDLMTIKGISVPDSDVSDDLSLYISIGDEYAGRIVLSDTLKQDAETGVAELKSSGMDSVILFTAESRIPPPEPPPHLALLSTIPSATARRCARCLRTSSRAASRDMG